MITTEEIRAILQTFGGKQTALANAAGVTQPTVSRWLAGAVPDAAQETRLRSLMQTADAPSLGAGIRPPPDFFGARDLPVYAAVEGGPGELVVSTDAIDFVPRPWFLGAVKDGYCVVVVGESMSPLFEPGDMAIVNPRLPLLGGKDLILTTNGEEGEFRATIKRLVKQTPDVWHLHQFNPPSGQKNDLKLNKRDWPKGFRVVGKYSGN